MSSNSTAPIFSFPTTVVLVDDNKAYLSKITIRLDKKTASYKCFSDAQEAYNYLQEHAKYPEFLKNCITHEVDPSRGHRNIDINLYPIRDEIYNPNRFEQVSVLVIDQEMPSLKGLDICEKLKNTPIKKILLTGEVDDRQAIEAFNKGIINKFISKNADDFYNTLDAAIAEQQEAFIREASSDIVHGLTAFREGYQPSCLIDPAFIKKLDEIVAHNKICEYYLSDDNGSYIMLDEKGKPSWLVLKDLDEMEADFCMADDDPNSLPEKLLKDLMNRKLIVHLFDKEEERLPAQAWEERKLLYPAKVLEGNEQQYYYVYIDNPDAHTLQRDKILPFRQYQENES